MHTTRIKIDAFKKYIHFLQEGFPMKMREIHIFNAPYFVDKILDMVKIFMKSELLDLVSIEFCIFKRSEDHKLDQFSEKSSDVQIKCK